MSVLIKSMKMPKEDTLMILSPDGTVTFMDHETAVAVEIPPHGRLIDADALPVSTAVPFDHASYEYVSLYNIRNAPTVIEAEEEEQ